MGGVSKGVKNLGHSLTHASDFEIGGSLGSAWDKMVHGIPTPPLDAGSTPTQGQANVAAIGKELDQEQATASTWTTLTGGQGALDGNATGPTLLGS